MDAENKEESCSQRDSAEPDLLGKIRNKDNLNRAIKRVQIVERAIGEHPTLLRSKEHYQKKD